MNRFTRAIVRVLVALVAAAGLTTMAAPSAQASATACGLWYGWMDVPKGTLCLKVQGSGLDITSQKADFTAGGRLGNWRIDWVIYYQGKQWWRDSGPTYLGTSFTGSRSRGSGWAPNGSAMCAELYQSSTGTLIKQVCVQIYR